MRVMMSRPRFKVRTRPFERSGSGSKSLSDGIRRAIAWLDSAPPARREVVITGPLTIGSIVDADLAAVPANIGIRFERSVAAAGTKRRHNAASGAGGQVRRTVTLSGPRTSVSDVRADAVARWPIEVVANPDVRPAIQAAIEAVMSQHVRMVPPDRPLRLLVVDQRGDGGVERRVASSIALDDRRIRPNRSRCRSADRSGSSAHRIVHPRFTAPPWQPIAGWRGRPAAYSAAAASGTLVIASAAHAGALSTLLLLRSLANNSAAPEAAMQAELLPIADGQLRAWTRPSAPVTAPRVETVERDDRRWLWVGVLALLAVEAWMRRARRDAVDTIDQETARVA